MEKVNLLNEGASVENLGGGKFSLPKECIQTLCHVNKFLESSFNLECWKEDNSVVLAFPGVYLGAKEGASFAAVKMTDPATITLPAELATGLLKGKGVIRALVSPMSLELRTK